MSKVVKVFAAVGFIALGVLTGGVAFLPGTALSFTVGAGTFLAIGLGLAASLIAPAFQKRLDRAAVGQQLQLGEVPRGAIFGRTGIDGSLVDAFNYGGKYGTDWEVLVIALADHECDALEGFFVNDSYHAFTGDGAVTGFNSQLEVFWRPGTWDQAVPSILTSHGPGWTANDRGRSVAYVVAAYKADEPDAKNPVWPSGRPRLKWVVRGLKCYQARLDTSVGGSGAHRRDDPATWSWTENPMDVRYNWVRGIYAGNLVAQPEMLLIGRGLTEIEAPPANVFARANLCDELVASEARYRIGGLILASESFLEVESAIAAACAGTIVQREGSVEIDPGAAKSPIAHFTDADLIVGSKVSWSDFLGDNDDGWVNTVVAQFIDPAQRWVQRGAPVKRDVADVIADGGPREKTLSVDLVTSSTQAQRLAEIARRLGRIWGRGRPTLPPQFAGIEEGDWITWTSARRFGGATKTFEVQAWQSGQNWHHSLTLREIASSVYSDAAAASDTAVGTQNPAPGALEAPGVSAWTATAGFLSGIGIRSPALIVSGGVDDSAASFVRFEYAQTGTSPSGSTQWTEAGTSRPSVTRREIPAAANTTYYVAVSYVVDGIAGARRVLGPIATGSLTYADGTPIEYLQPTEPDATRGARAGTDLFRSDGSTVMAQPEVRTIEGTAAFIAGQGSLATANSVDLDNQVSGLLSPTFADPALRNSELVPSIDTAATTANWTSVGGRPNSLSDLDNPRATRLDAGLTANGDVQRPIPATIRTQSNILSRTGGGTYVGDLAADVTAQNTAAFLNNQGALATANSVNLDNQVSGLLSPTFADQALRNSELVPSINIAATTANWTNVGGRPNSLSDLDNPRATRLDAGLAANGDVQRPIPATIRTQSNILSRTGGGTYVGDLAADVTAQNTAAFIAGQGVGATAPAQDVLNYAEASSNVHVSRPNGASLGINSPNVSGAIRIDLPQLWSSTMMRFEVEIFEYATGASVKYLIGGYNFSGGSWVNTFAQMVGSHTKSRTVRFGSRNGRASIWIGAPGDVWQFPKVQVTNFIGGFLAASYAAWGSGWSVSMDTSPAANDDGGTLVTITNPRASDAVFGVSTFESVGGALATTNNFKTNLGTAAFLNNQGALATKSSVNLASSEVANKSLANLDGAANTKLTGIETGADVTATAQRSIEPQFPVIEIKQGEAGHTGNRTVTHTIKRGTTTLSGGTWSLPAENLGAGDAAINSSTGLVTLSGIVQSGAYTVRYTHSDGVATDLSINVTYVPQVSAGIGSTGSSALNKTFSTTSFVAISNEITVVLPSGITSATLVASNIILEVPNALPAGSSNVEGKWQRETSPGTWADVGLVATAAPHPRVIDEGGFPSPVIGFLTCNRTATGLTAGSTQKFRFVARRSGGVSRTVTPFGIVSVGS